MATKKSKKKKPTTKKSASNKNSVGIMPMGDKVLVRPLSPEETGRKLASGIIIPETVDKEKPEQGIVVAVGPGKHGDDNDIIPVALQVGDKVMFSKYGFDEIKINGVEYFIVSEQNILAVIK